MGFPDSPVTPRLLLSRRPGQHGIEVNQLHLADDGPPSVKLALKPIAQVCSNLKEATIFQGRLTE
jgi:hypothetical protein